MLENVMEFFRNLPEKTCVECGEKWKSKVNATAITVKTATLYNQQSHQRNNADGFSCTIHICIR